MESRVLRESHDKSATGKPLQDMKDALDGLTTIHLLSAEAENKSIRDETEPGPDDRFEKNEISRYIRIATDQLDERSREIVTLYYYENMNLDDIAKRLKLSRSWVCRLHAKAISALHDKLAVLIGSVPDG
jgi:RNA polymerase sigma factor for flagellar operon FliA